MTFKEADFLTQIAAANARIEVVKAEIEAMKAANSSRQMNGSALKYNEFDFNEHAKTIDRISQQFNKALNGMKIKIR